MNPILIIDILLIRPDQTENDDGPSLTQVNSQVSVFQNEDHYSICSVLDLSGC